MTDGFRSYRGSSLLKTRQDDRTDRETRLRQAILHTLAYADIFDYPLNLAEIHRYLIGVRCDLDEIRQTLAANRWANGRIARQGDTFTLSGGEANFETRRQRSGVARRMWPKAVRYGRWLGRLPFVRMVALTGALSVGNSEEGGDLDYLVVTEAGRLWLCRLLVIALVRLAGLRGDVICPNYFLSENALGLSEPNLYAAHEMAQMAPMAGLEVYWQMRRLNPWVQRYLPNAEGLPLAPFNIEVRPARAWQAPLESALRTPLGERLEAWEMKRKIRKFNGIGANTGEVCFGADWCKGHFDHHQQRTLEAYSRRVQALEGEPV